jgi:hypothetical protein
MAIYYLDVDDEITSAAARIRDSGDSRIALVLSVGSRVATSRINFRLLAGEAKHRNKHLAIIAADPTVQSVARSAELPVFASVGDYEKAEAALAGAAHGASAGAVAVALDELSLTVGPGTPPARGGVRGTSRVPAAAYADGPAVKRSRVPWPAVAGLTFLALVLIVASGFFFYPSATIILTLHGEPVGPVTVSVKVDPSVTATNYQAGTVPGSKKAFPVQVSDTFQATGQKVVENTAAGTVTFTSKNTGSTVSVAAGTQVSTADGVVFVTTRAVAIPAADFDTHVAGKVDAPIKASKPGLTGNVDANTIVRLVPALKLVSVTNALPTTGGTHDVTPEVQQSDIDAAGISLWGRLQSSFKSAWQAPGATPSGSVLFAESAQLGLATCSPDPQGLVGQAEASFQLDCQASGSVTTVDSASIQDLVKRRVGTSVKPGYSLVDTSIATKMAAGSIAGSAFELPVTAQALQVPVVDIAKIKAAIQGKSVDEARTYLAQFGTVDISMSPGWSSSMPSFDFRIDIQVVDSTSTAGGSPAATVTGAAATKRTTEPGAQVPTPAVGSPAPASSSPPSPASATPASPAPSDTPLPVNSPSGPPSASPAL